MICYLRSRYELGICAPVSYESLLQSEILAALSAVASNIVLSPFVENLGQRQLMLQLHPPIEVFISPHFSSLPEHFLRANHAA
jgi:hypothetical protein